MGGSMKRENKVDIDTLYEELRDYCFEVLVDNTNSWRGPIGEDEKAVRARFAYIKGVSDAVRFMDNMLMYYVEDISNEEVD
jgi:hypothetical protein